LFPWNRVGTSHASDLVRGYCPRNLDQFFSRHWSAGLRFHYAQMLGDAGSSPVTAIAGSRDQYFVGIVGGYAL